MHISHENGSKTGEGVCISLLGTGPNWRIKFVGSFKIIWNLAYHKIVDWKKAWRMISSWNAPVCLLPWFVYSGKEVTIANALPLKIVPKELGIFIFQYFSSNILNFIMASWHHITEQMKNSENPVVFFDISVGTMVSDAEWKV